LCNFFNQLLVFLEQLFLLSFWRSNTSNKRSILFKWALNF